VRSPVAVRPARPEDLDVLVSLSLAARSESLVGSQLCTDDADRLRHQIGALVAEPGALGLVGTLDDELCGLVLARIVGPSLFTDEVTVSIEAVYVAEGARRRGVGHALLEALTERARDLGLSRLFCLTFEVDFFAAHGWGTIAGPAVPPEVYAELLRSHDDGVAEFLDLARVKPNTLGNTRMLVEL
jgi:amino-acid N-acetyltransferase